MAGMLFGIAGTGGASGALGTACDGDGSRNVRSVIDPELPFRCNVGLGPLCTDPAAELPIEDAEPDLRRVLFVWTSATDVGVVGRDRRAAPAAAEARDAFEAWFFKKACAAAVVAEGLALDPLRGYSSICQYTLRWHYMVLSATRHPPSCQSFVAN